MVADPLLTPADGQGDSGFETVVRQQTDFSCGTAALATVLRYEFGFEIDEPEITRWLLRDRDPGAVRAVGFSMLDLKRYVESKGLRARGYRLANLLPLADAPVPSIVLLDHSGARHFVVLRAVGSGRVVVADPEQGERWISVEEFEGAWVDRAGLEILGRNALHVVPAGYAVSTYIPPVGADPMAIPPPRIGPEMALF